MVGNLIQFAPPNYSKISYARVAEFSGRKIKLAFIFLRGAAALFDIAGFRDHSRTVRSHPLRIRFADALVTWTPPRKCFSPLLSPIHGLVSATAGLLTGLLFIDSAKGPTKVAVVEPPVLMRSLR